MIPQKGKHTMMLFLVIYIIFAGMLVYLFLFNTGLEITEQFNDTTNQKEVYLSNTTNRVINKVTVSNYKDEVRTQIAFIPQLQPHEKIKLELGKLKESQVNLLVEAPFHLGVEKLIVIKVTGKGIINITFPEDILFGNSFPFELELCNESTQEEKFRVEEEHDPGFFSEPNKTDIAALPANECKKIEYTLLPIQKGNTTIYFNVESSNSNEQYQQIILIK